MNNWLNVAVHGISLWPLSETTICFAGYPFILRPQTKESSASIHINLVGVSEKKAITLINRFLSLLSWCNEMPISWEYGFAGTAIPSPVKAKDKPFKRIGSCGDDIIDFPFFKEYVADKKAQLALAFYREGLTTESPPLRFLSFFKIISLCVEKDKDTPEKIREILSKLDDEDVICRKRKYESKAPQEDYAAYLYTKRRCPIAHGCHDPIIDPDDHDEDLHGDIEVVRAVASFIIEHEMRISRSPF